MEDSKDTIITLTKEIEYYKKQLNELSGAAIKSDYKMVEMGNEIRQMQRGFALIAGLNQFKPIPVFEEIYDHFTEEINIQMQMDLSLVLQPVLDQTYFAPSFIKGSSNSDIASIAIQKFLIPSTFIQEKKSLLVNSITLINPFIQSLSKILGIPYFILTPVTVQKRVIAYLVSGRKIENKLLAASQLSLHDVHALEAVAGVIAAIKNQHDQFHFLEKERTRISGEMHDDIGAEVTKIKLFSQGLSLKLKDDTEEKKKLESISAAASRMMQTINEIIWTMNSRNDTLSNMTAYIRRYASGYLSSHEIEYSMDFPEDVPPVFINNTIRRNIFLTVKEALHNIIKHACAKKVIIKLTYNDDYLKIIITDNGIGTASEKSQGKGLHNMKIRMQDCGGSIKVLSNPAKGTSISLCILLNYEKIAQVEVENTTLV